MKEDFDEEEYIYKTMAMLDNLSIIPTEIDPDQILWDIEHHPFKKPEGTLKMAIKKYVDIHYNDKFYDRLARLTCFNMYDGYKEGEYYHCRNDCSELFRSREELLYHLFEKHDKYGEIEIYEEDVFMEQLQDLLSDENYQKIADEFIGIPKSEEELLTMIMEFAVQEYVYGYESPVTSSVPKDFAALKERIKTGEVLRNKEFPYSKFIKDRDLDETEEKMVMYMMLLTFKNKISIYSSALDGKITLTDQELETIFPQEVKSVMIKLRHGLMDTVLTEEMDIHRGSLLVKLCEKSVILERDEYFTKNFFSNIKSVIPDEYKLTQISMNYLINPIIPSDLRPRKDGSYPDQDIRHVGSFHDGKTYRDEMMEYRRTQREEKKDDWVDFSDVVLPNDIKERIMENLLTKEQLNKIKNDWGLKKVMARSKGTVFLFTGPSGTGKTYTARAIANELGKRLHEVDYSSLVSKWVGDTEKNLVHILNMSEHEGNVLLFDECDGLLDRRSNGGTGADRGKDQTINIFLQEVEKRDVIIVMTTNFASKLDRALIRRFTLVEKFPYPDAEARKKIWELHLPNKACLDHDVDLELLAKNYELTGGGIKNVVLNAAKKAARENADKIRMEHFEDAIERELIKTEDMSYDINLDEGISKKDVSDGVSMVQ